MSKKINWAPIRELLAVRANYRCEACWKPFNPHPEYGFSVSHRFPRGGGVRADWLHLPSNLALFCGQGSEGSATCHGQCKDNFDNSMDLGWIISRFDRRLPSEIPIRLYDGWYLLDDLGGKVLLEV